MLSLVNFFKKRIAIGLVSGLISGTLVLGIGGRLAMRIISLMAGKQGGFSWGGTLDVVVLGLIIGILSGVVYGFVEKFGFSNSLLNGCTYGMLLFLILLILPIDGKGAAKGFPDLQLAIYLIFFLLLVLYGIVLAMLYSRNIKKTI